MGRRDLRNSYVLGQGNGLGGGLTVLTGGEVGYSVQAQDW